MATVEFFHLGQTTAIAPGVTHHYYLTKPYDEAVWKFSVDAYAAQPYVAALGHSVSVAITGVEYRYNFEKQPYHREVHFWVKNVGAIDATYLMHLAVIRD